MDAAVAPLTRTARLFSPLQVVIGTVFGSPIATIAMVASNLRVTGDQRLARQTLLTGPLVALAIAGLGALLPPGVSGGVVMCLALGVGRMVKQFDRPALPRQPLWLVVVIAVVGGVATLLLTRLLRVWLR